MNKTTRYAIAQNYPMRWESDPNASVFRREIVRLGGNMAEPTPQALRERWQEAG